MKHIDVYNFDNWTEHAITVGLSISSEDVTTISWLHLFTSIDTVILQ